MNRSYVLALVLALGGLLALAVGAPLSAGPAPEEQAPAGEPGADAGETAAPAGPAAAGDAQAPAPPPAAAPETPFAAALREKLAPPRTEGGAEIEERETLSAFYAARGELPAWVTPKGLTPGALAAAAEIQNADSWGLDAKAFALPEIGPADAAAPDLALAAQVAAEVAFSQAALKYIRHARGWRIPNPTALLTSNLDRRPQPFDAAAALEAAASAEDSGVSLRGHHPKHDQFEKLRAKYLAARDKGKTPLKALKDQPLSPGARHEQVAVLRRRLGGRVPPVKDKPGDAAFYDEELRAAVVAFQQNQKIEPADGVVNEATRLALNKAEKTDAQKLLANMEEWRWMMADMGDLYILANVPEFMLHLVKNGQTIWSERIVAGETGKQTAIFSRRIKHIVLRPKWRVPESIKVKELWPSLLRGGGLMNKYGLRLETKDGQPLDFHAIDWTKADIRDYEVTQPPGRNSVLGDVKFSFPSPHTIFMHDTPDKYMFNKGRRTLSHGCLRLRDPMRLAEILLAEDKGWTPGQIAELGKSGPLNNEVPIERRIPIHITYFTAWVGDAGAVQSFPDVYGHERRIGLALEGKWDKIDKGRDHLAPVEPDRSLPGRVAKSKSKGEDDSEDLFGGLFGGIF